MFTASHNVCKSTLKAQHKSCIATDQKSNTAAIGGLKGKQRKGGDEPPLPKKRSMTKFPVVTKEWNFALEEGEMLHQIALSPDSSPFPKEGGKNSAGNRVRDMA